eukprot:gnl/TRDRNA2_/TRDRNA2_48540_c0_seq1.p2 gnl/TRDRNA2_/TRDRNA2_48540_c0~~gnl/TRDRNA2_/TRDRNA2_48540_c0_seq1.p2  ORF type:complete len:188 (+),score=53.46 gnl/TRDRNA2_/TRDRNA2_48540_c0_seq1:74-637(+)
MAEEEGSPVPGLEEGSIPAAASAAEPERDEEDWDGDTRVLWKPREWQPIRREGLNSPDPWPHPVNVGGFSDYVNLSEAELIALGMDPADAWEFYRLSPDVKAQHMQEAQQIADQTAHLPPGDEKDKAIQALEKEFQEKDILNLNQMHTIMRTLMSDKHYDTLNDAGFITPGGISYSKGYTCDGFRYQ